ncbi:autophagy- protein 2 [Ascosphaera aggregata]|nr:autophagy- protein 2 [Ascosphaera aggregata]
MTKTCWANEGTFQAIATNLDLPSCLTPTEANIGLLRLSIPTTGSSAIVVEVESANLRLKFASDDAVTLRKKSTRENSGNTDGTGIRSPADLHAIVDSAPVEDKAELEAALPSVEGAFGNFLRSFRSSFASGPSSIARLVKDGALNRLQVKIKGIAVRFDMEVQDQATSSDFPPMVPVSALLSVADFFMGENAQVSSASGMKIERRRQIKVNQILAFLLSDPEVFDTHARFSPLATQFPVDAPYDLDASFSPTSPSDNSKVDFAMMQSTILENLSAKDAGSTFTTSEGKRGELEREAVYDKTATYLQASAQDSTIAGIQDSNTYKVKQSMYLSTISTTEPEESEADSIIDMPGAFATSTHAKPYDIAETVQNDEDDASAEKEDLTVTSARRLLLIEEITVNLLADDKQRDEPCQQPHAKPESRAPKDLNMQQPTPMMESTISRDFAAFSTILPSQPDLRPTDLLDTDKSTGDDSLEPAQLVEVEVPSVELNCDIACGWLIAKIVSRMTPVSKGKTPLSKDPVRKSATQPRLKLFLRNSVIKFAGRLPSITLTNGDVKNGTCDATAPLCTLFEVKSREIEASLQQSSNATHAALTVGQLSLRCGEKDMIRFRADQSTQGARYSESAPRRPDISINVMGKDDTLTINITTLPMVLIVNIPIIDETLSWIGGLSSVLDLGNSVASDSTAKVPPKTSDSTRMPTVRFDDDWRLDKLRRDINTPSEHLSPVCKVNLRINGLAAHLVGDECLAKLETSALKIVSRPGGIGIQIDKARCSGPYLSSDNGNELVASILDVENIRIEYLTKPQEADLDKLLALLTPSKDKFEPDDDVILDTLFKQRMQGPVLRVTVGNIAAKILDLELLNLLKFLGDDLDKLSKVTKYLPEDDQPGILAIVRLQKVDIEALGGELVGDISATLHDAEAAYVALPPLSAGKIGTIAVKRNQKDELVGPASHLTSATKLGSEGAPMIMARFISEELDPTINLKLYNLRLEYHIPTILAALGIKSEELAEKIAVEMTKSALGLAESQSQPDVHKSSDSDADPTPGTPRRLSAAFRDCHVGLSCRRSSSRGLFVISSGQLLGDLKEGSAVEASLQLHRASLMIIDDISNVAQQPFPSKYRNVAGDAHIQHLCDLGYVSVSSISSAVITVKAVTMDESQEKFIDVEVKDNLLILETCADSTQTLITILNSLSLPTPPAQDQKYRTEVVPIQEMLQSLNTETFFKLMDNCDDTSIDSAAKGLTIADEADYMSDFSPVLPDSNPVLGKKRPEQPLDSEADTSPDSLESNVSVASSFSSLDFQENHFARRLAVGGTAHRWDSINNTYNYVNDSKLLLSPLRIRVRDVHVIWNLFDGYDWKRTRDEISKAVQKVQADATEKGRWGDGQPGDCEDDRASVVGDFLFNSIYIDIPSNRDPQVLPEMINHDINDYASETTSHITSTTVTAHHRTTSRTSKGGKPLRLGRSKRHKMTFELKGISADLVVFPPGSDETQSSLDIRVVDLEIFDHITTSTWKKFATYMRDAGERETGASMVHLEILNVKPIPDLAASEIVLKATVLPLRLHVDQDALDFMTRFFGFKDDSVQPDISPAELPFIQRAEIKSIPVKLDFKPKRVDYGGLRSGRTTEFMNFFILEEANMVLRHCIIYGISGFDKLGQTLNDIWMPDVKANQLPREIDMLEAQLTCGLSSDFFSTMTSSISMKATKTIKSGLMIRDFRDSSNSELRCLRAGEKEETV